MSKKCCGFIYSDEDKICRICGSSLVDDEFISGSTRHMSDMDILLSSLSGNNTDNVEEYQYTENTESIYKEDINSYDVEEELETHNEASEDEYFEYDEDNYEAEEDVSVKHEDEAYVPEKYVVDLFASEDNKMDVLDEIEAEEQAVEEAKIKPGEEKAPTSMKVVGIVSIILAILALAMAGVFIYFMVIKPSYDKSGASLKQMIYPEIATSSDVDLSAPRDHISHIPLATSTDYTVYEPVEPEIANTDSTVTDATATDASEESEVDVVE